jgi:hypothetical protein
MANLTPEEMLKKTTRYAEEVKNAVKGNVVVGLPVEKVGGKIYGDGMTVMRVGAIHEFGRGHNPRRSFLRTPFAIKKKELATIIDTQFLDVFSKGKTAKQALGLIGVAATNISKGAFTSDGYGEWPPLKPSTIKAKGSSQILIDNGILRGSVTYVVRGL